jgi:uncharacterized protein DUF3854
MRLEHFGPYRQTSPTSWMATCPCHEDTLGSLSVSVGDSGDLVVMNCFGGCRFSDVLGKIGWKVKDLMGTPGGFVMTSPLEPTVDWDERDRVYRLFLSGLPLLQKHLDYLAARGQHAPVAHQKFGYRSLAEEGIERGIARVTSVCGLEALMRTPGFVEGPYGRPTTAVTEGMAVPVMDRGGLIRALQVRQGEGKDAKFLWLSSYSGQVKAQVHWAAPYPLQQADVVRLTEGPIKANTSFSYTGIPSLAIPGAGLWKMGVSQLRKLKLGKVLLAFDMDWTVKADVRRARRDCHLALRQAGIPVVLESWDERWKGIDDCLVNGGKVRETEDEG